MASKQIFSVKTTEQSQILNSLEISNQNQDQLKKLGFQKNPDETAVQEEPHNSSLTKKDAVAPKITHQGWVRIGGACFQNKSRYPKIPIINQNKSFDFDIMDHAKNGKTALATSIANIQYNSADESTIKFIDSFYLRLQDTGLVYFEETDKEDQVVIGAMNVIKVDNENVIGMKNCFKVTDAIDVWTVCGQEEKDAENWVCAILKTQGKSCTGDEDEEKDQDIVQPVIIIPLPSPNCRTDWTYEHHGLDWQCKCNEGLQQSPIELPFGGDSVEVTENDATFEYKDVKYSDIKIVWENNLLRIMFKNISENSSFGKIIDTDRVEYKATEIQIHLPGEHQLGDRKVDMEIQVIHESVSPNNYQKQAVLSILFQSQAGGQNPEMENWDFLSIPLAKGGHQDKFFQEKNAKGEELSFNVNKLIYPKGVDQSPYPKFSYYKYMGSLTTPPCEESVVWFVISKPRQIGTANYNLLQDALGESISNLNRYIKAQNRVLQKIEQRVVVFYDGKEENIDENDDYSGHWEKRKIPVERFVVVKGQEPSLIPGAFVVSKLEAEMGIEPTKRVTDRHGLQE